MMITSGFEMFYSFELLEEVVMPNKVHWTLFKV